MYMKNGVWMKGPPPSSKSQKIVSHRSQRTVVASSTRRLDALVAGKARICIARSLGGLGDIIMATPIARGVKRKYPNSHVTFAIPIDYAGGDLADLLLYNPFIDEIIDYKLVSRDDYDAFSDYTRAGLPQEKPYTIPKNRIDLFAEACGIPLYGMTTPIYVVTEEERAWGIQFVKKQVKNPQQKKIAIHLRSNDPKRTWPSENLREFIALAAERGYHCFLFGWGDRPDQWRLKENTLVFDYKLRQAASILAQCDVLVCPDSCLLHLGGALNIRTISLFGSMPPASRINYYPNATAIVDTHLPCIGCVYAPCQASYRCMKGISAQAVLEAVEGKLTMEIINPITASGYETSIYEGTFLKKEIRAIEL
jgi:ADP-heptose:LPS heptosyltransferase